MSTKSLIPPPKSLVSYQTLRRKLLRMHDTIPNSQSNNLSIEHAVPRSHFSDTIHDYHNLFVLPIQYNHVRSNYKLVDHLETQERKVHDWSVSHQHKICSPGVLYRGVYARCCGYVLGVYPHISHVLFRHVIEPHTLLEWHRTYPVTEEEGVKSCIGKTIQGNVNVVVEYTECLEWILQKTLSFK